MAEPTIENGRVNSNHPRIPNWVLVLATTTASLALTALTLSPSSVLARGAMPTSVSESTHTEQIVNQSTNFEQTEKTISVPIYLAQVDFTNLDKTKSNEKDSTEMESMTELRAKQITALYFVFLHESAKPLNEKYLLQSGYYNRESFMTTNAGITEMTYAKYLIQNNLPQKFLRQITLEETFDILLKGYWSRVPDLDTLPLSISAMRYQAIINMGVGRPGNDVGEWWVWNRTKALLKGQIKNWNNLASTDQNKILIAYRSAQLEYYNDPRVNGNENGGLNNRVNNAFELCSDILNNPERFIQHFTTQNEKGRRLIDQKVLNIIFSTLNIGHTQSVSTQLPAHIPKTTTFSGKNPR